MIINQKSKIKDQKYGRVLVGISGGVDSSVAAAILKKQNYDVIGVFLKFTRMDTNRYTNKHESENKCCDYESLLAARQVAEKLKIPFYVLDASKKFKKEVVDYFISEFDAGRTPNPCVICNKKIKFGWMLEQAKKLGCDFVATGHYSRIVREIPNNKSQTRLAARQISNKFQITNSKFQNKSKILNLKSEIKLYRAKDKKKDQSYFLWQLTQDQLKYILFPIGNYHKSEVRKMASKWKLLTANKKESQDLCFISTADKADFLADRVNRLNKPGNIVDLKGNILGEHIGLCHYTVGQRHNLGVQIPNDKFQITNKSQIPNSKSKKLPRPRSAKRGGQAISCKLKASFQPAYVIKLDVENNQLIVGHKKDLYTRKLIAKDVHWIQSKIKNEKSRPKADQLRAGKIKITDQRSKNIKYKAKIRYGASLANCQILELSHNRIKVIFDQPQRAVTPGQSIVFYQKENLIGGGIIEKTF